MLKKIIILSWILLISTTAQAKRFKNSYVSFELPPRWECHTENTAWICRYKINKNCHGSKANSKSCKSQKKKSKEAIILLTAKKVGLNDSLKIYQKHLKGPRPITTTNGNRSKSKVIHVKHVKVANHSWIDGMHLGSEIPNYYTRYLATIKGNIAVLVTFSAHKRFYTKYSSHFFKAIKGIKVVATKTTIAELSKNTPHKNNGPLGPSNININMPGDLDGSELSDIEEPEGGSHSTVLFLSALMLAIVGVYIAIKRRRH